MDKPFRTAPLEMLARWIFHGLDAQDTVLGIPKQNLQLPSPRLAATMFGHTVAAPLGVAAGPHTQLAQNIVASWLCGARVIELKTVQILDEIAVSRPCIDAAASPELEGGGRPLSGVCFLGRWIRGPTRGSAHE